MTVTATVRVMSAEEIVAQGGGETPALRWPERSTVFAERAMRLAQRGTGGLPMADYLMFVSAIAMEQQQVLAAFPEVPLPDAAALATAAAASQPPLSADHWPRDPAWQTGLVMLATNLRPRVPATVQHTIDRLLAMPADERERQAGRLLTGVMQGLDMATAPLIAAALQVYWTHLVTALQARDRDTPRALGRIADETICPCCGSRPTASVTRSNGSNHGQRYLHCALCGLEWHQMRIRCTHCLSSQSVAYQALDAAGADSAASGSSAGASLTGDAASRAARASIQAETCDECGHYLKLMHTDRDAFLDPIADDLATLPLDLLVSEAGLRRHGVNLMLLMGDTGDDATADASSANVDTAGRPPDPGGH